MDFFDDCIMQHLRLLIWTLSIILVFNKKPTKIGKVQINMQT